MHSVTIMSPSATSACALANAGTARGPGEGPAAAAAVHSAQLCGRERLWQGCEAQTGRDGSPGYTWNVLPAFCRLPWRASFCRLIWMLSMSSGASGVTGIRMRRAKRTMPAATSSRVASVGVTCTSTTATHWQSTQPPSHIGARCDPASAQCLTPCHRQPQSVMLRRYKTPSISQNPRESATACTSMLLLPTAAGR